MLEHKTVWSKSSDRYLNQRKHGKLFSYQTPQTWEMFDEPQQTSQKAFQTKQEHKEPIKPINWFFDQQIKPINAMKPIKAIKPGCNRPHPGRFLSSLVGGSSDNQF